MIREMSTFGGITPELQDRSFSGRLFVLEGPDGSGRSTQITRLTQWLEANGFAVKTMGLLRSALAREELEEAKQGNTLTHTTLSLFYATDFFDQLVHEIVPALKAGFVVLADRYIYTLMARDILRGADRNWVRNLYRPALIPDAVWYLRVSPQHLVERTFQKNTTLDYWESGMDLPLSRDMFDSFIKYQSLLQTQFKEMSEEFGFRMINGNRRIEWIQRDLRTDMAEILGLSPERPKRAELLDENSEE